MRGWQLAPTPPIPDDDLLTLVDHQQVLAEILCRRGYGKMDRARGFLDPSQYEPAPPTDLPDLERAALLLREAIDTQKTILIWGDFDVDGQTASALLLDALKPLTDVRLHIPDRVRDGHGISVESLKNIIETDHPALLLTCDTGISAHDTIDFANAYALTTIITDHHDLPPRLPDADAIINPKRLPPEHPLHSLPGVGVAYKLIQHLYYVLDRSHETPRLLDLVALGIVADVAEQTADTRYLLQIGLEKLRHTERPGLRALLEVARRDPATVTADEIGYQLGPRLNAAGRLGDPLLAVELLTTRDAARVPILAQQLEGLNARRRQLQRETETSARQQITDDPSLLDYRALILFGADWHAGILGPVAGRLAEDYQRPVVLLTAVNERVARGSGRSAGDYDLSQAISATAELLLGYGGHPGAAGVTLPIVNIAAFRRALSESLVRLTPALSDSPSPSGEGVGGEGNLLIDSRLPLDSITPSFVAVLDRLAPFGEGNPQPIFQTDDLQIISAAFLDRLHEHRRLTVQDANGVQCSVFWWNSGSLELPTTNIDLAYTLRLNANHEVEIVLMDYRLHDQIAAVPHIGPRLIDCRTEADPLAALAQLKADVPNLTVWAEGFAKAEAPGVPRHELTPGCPLAIFTAPPTPGVLADVLNRLNPPAIYLFGVEPSAQSPREFLRQLEGIAKFVINRQGGQIDLATLCGRTAQSEGIIRMGIAMLPGMSSALSGNTVQFLTRSDSPSQSRQLHAPETQSERGLGGEANPRFAALLEESRAYRDYFRRAPLASLLTTE